MTAPVPRPYQVAAVDAVRERFRAGDHSTMIVMATGLGKTVTFADIIARTVARGRRALVLAHRTELLSQALDKLRAAGVDAALEQGPARGGDAPSVVASVATLRGRRLEAWPRDAFGLVVVDECHHATSASYRAILGHFDRAYVLGCTATPDRADGAAMGDLFQSVAYRYEIAEAIRDGWLAPVHARRVRVDVNLDAVRTVGGDFDQGQLGQVMCNAAVTAAIADAIIEQAGDRRTILFSVSVAHAHELAQALNERRPGIARAVSGQSSAEERAAAARDLASGAVQIVANAALWTEGFDLPAVSCIALARPTKSRALYAQCVGRGTRLAPGKADLLLLDFVANTRRHKLIGPADVLAGADVSEEAKRRADERLEGDGGDVLEELAAAEAAEQAEIDRMVKIAAELARERRQIRWMAEEVADLFGERLELDPDRWPEPATESQVAALKRAGIEQAMTKGQASELLASIQRRRDLGLCTYKQARLLKKLGITNAAELSFQAASALINVKLGRDRVAYGAA